MGIQVRNLQSKIPLNSSQVKKIVKAILKYQRINEFSLNIVFVTNSAIKKLNKKFLGRGYATDVLSFDLRDKFFYKRKEVAGEVVICAEAAVKNAKIYGNDLKNEIALYIVHGILHLLGFDDSRPKEIKRMRRKEQEILRHLDARINGLI